MKQHPFRVIIVLCALLPLGCSRAPSSQKTCEMLRDMGFQPATRDGKVWISADELLSDRQNTLSEADLIRLAGDGSGDDNSRTLRIAALVTLGRESPEKAKPYVESALTDKDPMVRRGAMVALVAQPAIRESFRNIVARLAREDPSPAVLESARHLMRLMEIQPESTVQP